MTAISKGSDTGPSNPFQALWDLGYTRLVPVIPPNAPISDKSQLAARLRAGEDARGKAPGVRRQDGTWSGMDFVGMEAREPDLAVWADMGASVGIKTGQGIFAVDIDTRDKAAARKLFEIAAATLGPAHVRFGQHPKCLLVYATPDDIPYGKVSFSTETEDVAAVEVLTEGRQFVAHGTHPKTGKLYVWPEGIPKRQALTEVTKDKLDGFLAQAAQVMPKARREHSAAVREAPDQEALQAPDWETLKRYVEAVPNTSALFPTRNSYVQMAYAIKGAAPDGHEHAALDLYLDWCERWDGGENGEQNDPDVALADWNRAKPPFRTGFSFIRQHATALWFTPVEVTVADDMFAAVEPVREGRKLHLFSDQEMQNRPDLKWLVARHIPEDGFGILYGDPGTGKSFIALDMALHIATGRKDWHGDEITGGNGGAVLYIAGEGAGDFKARLTAWKMRNYVPGHYIPDDRFRVIIEPLNFMRTDDVGRLLEAVKSAGLPKLSLVIIDTVSRAIAGAEENLQKDMSIFVQACDAVRAATGAFVLGVHHSSKAGELRGSSALPGAADAIFRFERKKGQMIGRLSCQKMKAGPDTAADPYRLELVGLGEGQSSLVPVRVEEAEAQDAACSASLREEILRSLQRAWDDGSPWSMSRRTGDRWGPKVVCGEFGVPAEAAEQWLSIWMEGEDRLIREDVRDRRNKVRGLRRIVEGDVLSGSTDTMSSETDVFE